MKTLKLIFIYIIFIGTVILWFLPDYSFLNKVVFVLVLCCSLALIRVIFGPTAPDRALATDIFGLVVIGFCAVLYLETKKAFYLDIAIAWALQSFIGVLALSKYLEGRKFDD